MAFECQVSIFDQPGRRPRTEDVAAFFATKDAGNERIFEWWWAHFEDPGLSAIQSHFTSFYCRAASDHCTCLLFGNGLGYPVQSYIIHYYPWSIPIEEKSKTVGHQASLSQCSDHPPGRETSFGPTDAMVGATASDAWPRWWRDAVPYRNYTWTMLNTQFDINITISYNINIIQYLWVKSVVKKLSFAPPTYSNMSLRGSCMQSTAIDLPLASPTAQTFPGNWAESWSCDLQAAATWYSTHPHAPLGLTCRSFAIQDAHGCPTYWVKIDAFCYDEVLDVNSLAVHYWPCTSCLEYWSCRCLQIHSGVACTCTGLQKNLWWMGEDVERTIFLVIAVVACLRFFHQAFEPVNLGPKLVPKQCLSA